MVERAYADARVACRKRRRKKNTIQSTQIRAGKLKRDNKEKQRQTKAPGKTVFGLSRCSCRPLYSFINIESSLPFSLSHYPLLFLLLFDGPWKGGSGQSLLVLSLPPCRVCTRVLSFLGDVSGRPSLSLSRSLCSSWSGKVGRGDLPRASRERESCSTF